MSLSRTAWASRCRASPDDARAANSKCSPDSDLLKSELGRFADVLSMAVGVSGGNKGGFERRGWKIYAAIEQAVKKTNEPLSVAAPRLCGVADPLEAKEDGHHGTHAIDQAWNVKSVQTTLDSLLKSPPFPLQR